MHSLLTLLLFCRSQDAVPEPVFLLDSMIIKEFLFYTQLPSANSMKETCISSSQPPIPKELQVFALALPP